MIQPPRPSRQWCRKGWQARQGQRTDTAIMLPLARPRALLQATPATVPRCGGEACARKLDHRFRGLGSRRPEPRRRRRRPRPGVRRRTLLFTPSAAAEPYKTGPRRMNGIFHRPSFVMGNSFCSVRYNHCCCSVHKGVGSRTSTDQKFDRRPPLARTPATLALAETGPEPTEGTKVQIQYTAPRRTPPASSTAGGGGGPGSAREQAAPSPPDGGSANNARGSPP